MKINRFKKKKNGQYEIELDEETLLVHEDLILKYNLLLTKEVTPELLEQIKKDNLVYDAYTLSLKAINTRLRSKKEIATYLEKKGYSYDIITTVITMLANQGYLNDQRYALSFVHDKMSMSMDGPNKIRILLLQQEIDLNFIDDALNEFTSLIQEEKIRKLIAKEIRSNHSKSQKVLQQKIAYRLIQLGYSKELVFSLLKDYSIDDKDVQEKEYKKIYEKLSKKYSGKELEYKVRQKMYQRGFTNL